MKALFNISIKLSKEKLIVIDFTDLKGIDIKLFIASVVTKGRTLPFSISKLFPLPDYR